LAVSFSVGATQRIRPYLLRASLPVRQVIIVAASRTGGPSVASPETKKRFETEGAKPLSMRPEEVGRFIAAETAK
jgi:tripartite-type tricarboxylate transporter receptor subunit TctC